MLFQDSAGLIYLETIAKQKVYAEFDMATLLPMSTGNMSTLISGCRPNTKYSSVVRWRWILLSGDRGLNTDGRHTYNICLASANQMCTIFQSHTLVKRNKIEFSLILILIILKNDYLLYMLMRSEIRTFGNKS